MDNHSISSILLNLPLALQDGVLGSWLTNADVCNLDSAFCSKEMRPQFLNILASEDMFLHSPKLTDLEAICSWMAWVIARKVCIDACHLSSAVPPAMYIRFFTYVCKTLKKATIFANRKVYTKSEYSNMIATIACCCRNLSEIQLQHCESLGSLENLLYASQGSLIVINLLYCDLSELKLRNIHLPSLNRLIVENCTGVSETIASGFLEAAPNLEVLHFGCVFTFLLGFKMPDKLRVLILVSSSQLTDAIFCSVVHICPLLELVELSNCTLLTDTSLVQLAQRAKYLRYLFLEDNVNFSDTALEAISSHCGERLKQVGIKGCDRITNAGFNRINERCHQLDGLHVEFMEQISTAAVASVLRVNPLLREVSLGSYSEEDGDVLLTVISTCCRFVEYFDIIGLKGYTAEGVFAVVKSCPQLRTIVVNPNDTIVNPFSRMLLVELNPNMKICLTPALTPVQIQYSIQFVVGTEMLGEAVEISQL